MSAIFFFYCEVLCGEGFVPITGFILDLVSKMVKCPDLLSATANYNLSDLSFILEQSPFASF